jgi:hypothetical protein
VTAILERSFQADDSDPPHEYAPGTSGTGGGAGSGTGRALKGSQAGGGGAGARSIGRAELRALVHFLFSEPCPSTGLASMLLADVVTACLSFDSTNKRKRGGEGGNNDDAPRGAIAALDSYIVAALCALACEVQFDGQSKSMEVKDVQPEEEGVMDVDELHVEPEVQIAQYNWPAEHEPGRVLRLLKEVLALNPKVKGGVNAEGVEEVLAGALITAHVAKLLVRALWWQPWRASQDLWRVSGQPWLTRERRRRSKKEAGGVKS